MNDLVFPLIALALSLAALFPFVRGQTRKANLELLEQQARLLREENADLLRRLDRTEAERDVMTVQFAAALLDGMRKLFREEAR